MRILAERVIIRPSVSRQNTTVRLALRGFARRDLSVKLRRPVARNGKRDPLVTGKMLGQIDDLSAVISVVSHLPVDGLHHRVSFPRMVIFLASRALGQRQQRVEYKLSNSSSHSTAIRRVSLPAG